MFLVEQACYPVTVAVHVAYVHANRDRLSTNKQPVNEFKETDILPIALKQADACFRYDELYQPPWLPIASQENDRERSSLRPVESFLEWL